MGAGLGDGTGLGDDTGLGDGELTVGAVKVMVPLVGEQDTWPLTLYESATGCPGINSSCPHDNALPPVRTADGTAEYVTARPVVLHTLAMVMVPVGLLGQKNAAT